MNNPTQPAPKTRDISEHGTDWDYLATVTDEEIARAVASDPDAAPIPSDVQLRRGYKPHSARIKR